MDYVSELKRIAEAAKKDCPQLSVILFTTAAALCMTTESLNELKDLCTQFASKHVAILTAAKN